MHIQMKQLDVDVSPPAFFYKPYFDEDNSVQ